MNFRIFILLCFLFCIRPQASANNAHQWQISLLTCSPGNQIYSIYGHNAIRVYNPVLSIDIVYNYGTFDFQTPGFAIKFMRGKLPYLLSTDSYERFLFEYNYFQRDVTEQILLLDSLSKQKIISFLEENYQPQNRAYAYDFFYDNCATRLRDLIGIGAGADLRWDEASASNKTFRQIIKEYQAVWPWLDFGVDLIIGARGDEITTLKDEAFIPDYLMYAVTNARIHSDSLLLPLAGEQQKILIFDKKQHKNGLTILMGPFAVFLLLLGIEFFIFLSSKSNLKGRWLIYYDKSWFILLIISGLLMIFMWFGTDHLATRDNWNILWANPLILILFLPKISEKFKNLIARMLLFLILVSILNALPIWQLLPQYFNPVAGLIAMITGLKLIRNGYVKKLPYV